ncbi:MAG: STAS domain-containing protein [Acidimicrobiales bacterium]
MDLNIQVSDASGAAVVAVTGEIGPDTAPAFGKALDHLCGKARPVMVDLQGLVGIDNLGMSVLVQSFRRLRQDHCALIVVAPSPEVRRVMSESGVEDFMPICRTLDEAAALITILQRNGGGVPSPSAPSAAPEGHG